MLIIQEVLKKTIEYDTKQVHYQIPEPNREMCGALHCTNFDHRFCMQQGKPDITEVLFHNLAFSTTSSYLACLHANITNEQYSEVKPFDQVNWNTSYLSPCVQPFINNSKYQHWIMMAKWQSYITWMHSRR